VDDHIRVRISDDGSGFQKAEDKIEGVGILNMKHRIILLGGTINWLAADPSGTEVRIDLPLQT
jgi:signal transduction histidine kinase